MTDQDIIIRPLHPDDAEDLHAIWRHPQVGLGTMQLPSQEISLTLDRIHNSPPTIHRLVAEVNKRVVGAITLNQYRKPRMAHAATLGMAVHPDYWGRGIGNRLLEAIIDLADNWLNLRRIELDVYSDNAPAIHLYEKFGFVLEGRKRMHAFRNGRYAETLFMARIREENIT